MWIRNNTAATIEIVLCHLFGNYCLEDHGKVIEKTLPDFSDFKRRVVLGIVPTGGTEGTRTELSKHQREDFLKSFETEVLTIGDLSQVY